METGHYRVVSRDLGFLCSGYLIWGVATIRPIAYWGPFLGKLPVLVLGLGLGSLGFGFVFEFRVEHSACSGLRGLGLRFRVSVFGVLG